MRIREANEIEYEYIFEVTKVGNYNIDNVIIHSVIERADSVKYAIEVHHEDRVSLFTGTKSEIDNKILPRNYFKKEDVFNVLKKFINDVKVLKKYYSNFDGLVIEQENAAFVVKPTCIYVCAAKPGKDYSYYVNAKSYLTFNSIVEIEINTGSNYSNIDRIYADSMRLAHDSTSYSHGNGQDLDIEYFKNSDYFAVSTICDIQQDSFEYLSKIYNELETIKNLEYKFKTGENIADDDRSYYRKFIKMYMQFDLEEAILTEIEKKYADYIKVS